MRYFVSPLNGKFSDKWRRGRGRKVLFGDAFGIDRPVSPARLLRQWRAIIVARACELLLLGVENLEEQNLHKLKDALGLAIDADVFAHDVLDGFDGGGKGHYDLRFRICRLRAGGLQQGRRAEGRRPAVKLPDWKLRSRVPLRGMTGDLLMRRDHG